MTEPGTIQARIGSNGSSGLSLTTIILIIITGGGNWLATKTSTDFNAHEIEQATREIHALYPKLEDAIERQQRMQDSVDQILKKMKADEH